MGARQLDPDLATPAWSALAEREHDFAARFAVLRAGGPSSALQRTMPWMMGALALVVLALAAWARRAYDRRKN